MRWLRRSLSVLLIVVVQVIVVAALLEGSLRLFGQRVASLRPLVYLPAQPTIFDRAKTTRDLVQDSVYGKGLVPGSVHQGFALNSLGFRTEEYTVDKPPDTFRVVALGDSFTFGAVPHTDMWTEQLERNLSERLPGGRRAEVISLGVPGVGPEHYLRMWQLEGRRLHADLVVLGFFIGNDFEELAGPERVPSELRDRSLIERSLLARAVRNAWITVRHRRERDAMAALPATDRDKWGHDIPEAIHPRGPLDPSMGEGTFNDVEWRRLWIARLDQRDRLLARMDLVRAILADLRADIEANGARLVVLVIPDEFQVDDDLRQRLLDLHELPAKKVRPFYAQQRLEQFLERQGFAFVDPLVALREHTQSGERMYLFRDTHWNPSGNRLAGDALADYVVEHDLLH